MLLIAEKAEHGCCRVKIPSKINRNESSTEQTSESPSSDAETAEVGRASDRARVKNAKQEEVAAPRQQANSTVIQNLVFFFHAPGCPYSWAMRPLMECLPKYFSEMRVAFISQDNTGPPAPNFKGGVIATPAVKAIDQVCSSQQHYYSAITSISMCFALLIYYTLALDLRTGCVRAFEEDKVKVCLLLRRLARCRSGSTHPMGVVGVTVPAGF